MMYVDFLEAPFPNYDLFEKNSRSLFQNLACLFLFDKRFIL